LPEGRVILGVAADRVVDVPLRLDTSVGVEHKLIGDLIQRAS
jgi:hypothetical protein